RRHTRFSRDWSSDVCSSDLETQLVGQCVEPFGEESGLVVSFLLRLARVVDQVCVVDDDNPRLAVLDVGADLAEHLVRRPALPPEIGRASWREREYLVAREVG